MKNKAYYTVGTHIILSGQFLKQSILYCRDTYYTVGTVPKTKHIILSGQFLKQSIFYCRDTYYTVGTVPEANKKNVETEATWIPLINLYKTAHLSGLVQALQ